MENALLKLWAMVGDSKSARVTDNLESALTIHHLTTEKNNLEANYDKLVKDVHEVMNSQEERVLDFSYLESNLTYQQQCLSEPVSDMKGEMAKKDVDLQHLNEKYQLLVNLTRAQGTVIQNRNLKHMKEKELLSEARMKVESPNVELTKCEENLTQDKLELKLQVVDLLKENEKHVEEKGQLKLQIAELMEGEDKLQEKIKGIQAILEK
ncbi:Anthocyanin 3'-O-beta-glucosyltransferase [Hordeum vulgare]|nr:Anthocyanin 3'-O-beta-glucosyltransferase [Hordeum vulgare]